MEKTIRNAIVHNVNFALRPGPHWKIPPVLDRLLTERARQDFGESWWDDPLLREKLDSSQLTQGSHLQRLQQQDTRGEDENQDFDPNE